MFAKLTAGCWLILIIYGTGLAQPLMSTSTSADPRRNIELVSNGILQMDSLSVSKVVQFFLFDGLRHSVYVPLLIKITTLVLSYSFVLGGYLSINSMPRPFVDRALQDCNSFIRILMSYLQRRITI
jgi:hypothetical protein